MLADFLGRAGGGGELLGPTGGGGGKGLPAMGLLLDKFVLEGFLGSVPFLDGAGLGSAVIWPLDFLALLGGAMGPDPELFETRQMFFCLFIFCTWHFHFG